MKLFDNVTWVKKQDKKIYSDNFDLKINEIAWKCLKKSVKFKFKIFGNRVS